MDPFSSQHDKGKSNLGQLSLSKGNNYNLKRAADRTSTFEHASKRTRDIYNDNLINRPASSSFPHRRTIQETNFPETNYYSQPIQTMGNRYYDSMPMRGSLEEENNFLQSKLTALMEDFQRLYDLRYTEAEQSLLEQEQVIQQLEEGSKIYSDRMDTLEESLGKVIEEDTNIPVKADTNENSELKAKLKKLYNEGMEKEKKLKQEIKVLKELSGITTKETKIKDEGVEYTYHLTGRDGSLDFSILLPNHKNKQVTYSPKFEPHEVTGLEIPDFLHENIMVDRNQLNKLFWRLSTVLYENNNKDDAK